MQNSHSTKRINSIRKALGLSVLSFSLLLTTQVSEATSRCAEEFDRQKEARDHFHKLTHNDQGERLTKVTFKWDFPSAKTELIEASLALGACVRGEKKSAPPVGEVEEPEFEEFQVSGPSKARP